MQPPGQLQGLLLAADPLVQLLQSFFLLRQAVQPGLLLLGLDQGLLHLWPGFEPLAQLVLGLLQQALQLLVSVPVSLQVLEALLMLCDCGPYLACPALARIPFLLQLLDPGPQLGQSTACLIHVLLELGFLSSGLGVLLVMPLLPGELALLPEIFVPLAA